MTRFCGAVRGSKYESKLESSFARTTIRVESGRVGRGVGGSETRASVVVVRGQPQTKLVGPAPYGRGVTLMPLSSHTGEKVSWNIFAFVPRSMREMPRGVREAGAPFLELGGRKAEIVFRRPRGGE